ncbi:MAG: hypothetical protein AAF213_11765, partial [Pseudomonadota bacterium]
MVGFLGKVAIATAAFAAAGPLSYLIKSALDSAKEAIDGPDTDTNPLRGAVPLDDLSQEYQAAFIIGTISGKPKLGIKIGSMGKDKKQTPPQDGG